MLRSYLPAASATLLALLVAVAYFIPHPQAVVPLETAQAPISSTTPAEATPSPADAAGLASVATAPAPAAAPLPTGSLTAAGATLLKSTVNILCLARSESGFKSISGSGVVIDSRGLILTAAHIGQYFLLADYPKPHTVVCTIRTGGPATDAYTAEAVYVSPSWIKDNADNLSEAAPKGTGQNDFAILAITGSATKAPLPHSFTYVPLSFETPAIGEKTAIGGYAAQYLASRQVEDALYPTIVFDSITNRFTFGDNSVDVIAIKGTAAAQEGSSGGGIADAQGELVGVITTSSTKGDVSEHTLNAITVHHIRESFAADSGTDTDLDSYLSSNPLSTLISNFTDESRSLAQILVNANK